MSGIKSRPIPQKHSFAEIPYLRLADILFIDNERYCSLCFIVNNVYGGFMEKQKIKELIAAAV